ncbi:TetR/AcrR family transcriptional regulator [Novosphingobium sp.]|uniref:TetR/AcrR family transcriptional regulator n=1 Tax=Novosphingobium sp. TaxID=1874826 RepID=UPI00352B9AB1
MHEIVPGEPIAGAEGGDGTEMVQTTMEPRARGQAVAAACPVGHTVPPRVPGTRNAAATIERILASAEAEFGSRGIDSARIDDIAKAAGISKQLIYHYFDGKDDIYGALLVHIARRNMTLVCAIDYDALDPIEAVRAFFETLFRAYRGNPFTSTIPLDQGLHGGAHVRYDAEVAAMRDDFYRRFGDAIDRGKGMGLIRPEIDVAALHFLAIVLVSGAIALMPMFVRYTRRKAGSGHPAPDATCEQFTEYFMRAVMA